LILGISRTYGNLARWVVLSLIRWFWGFGSLSSI